MLSRFLSSLFGNSVYPDNSQEIENIKRESKAKTDIIKNKSVARSQKTARGFEQTGKRVYDVAEKIYIATGQHR